jgi:hypothetical protein
MQLLGDRSGRHPGPGGIRGRAASGAIQNNHGDSS